MCVVLIWTFELNYYCEFFSLPSFQITNFSIELGNILQRDIFNIIFLIGHLYMVLF